VALVGLHGVEQFARFLAAHLSRDRIVIRGLRIVLRVLIGIARGLILTLGLAFAARGRRLARIGVLRRLIAG